jgi:hypothetical protein
MFNAAVCHGGTSVSSCDRDRGAPARRVTT